MKGKTINASEFLINSCEKFPNNTAISDFSGKLSYKDLFLKSFLLSEQIRDELGDKQNVPISLPADKSIDSVIIIFSILLSGNIYVPYDRECGENRKISILNSIGNVLTIMSKNKLDSEVEEKCNKIIYLDESEINNADFDKCIEKAKINLSSKISLDPAYIIFTSGSTGIPKGVTISHEGIIDYIYWACSEFEINESDVFASQAPFIFDNSTLDIYLSIANGAELYLPEPSLFTFPYKLVEQMNTKKVSFIFWVPSVFNLFYRLNIFEEIKPEFLKNILFAGEVMQADILKYWMKNLPKALYANLYGPTEITVDCTYYKVPSDFNLDEVPIGVKCKNSDYLVIDEKNKKSKKGELYIRGVGNSLGYWGDKDKTDKSFVQNPLHEDYVDFCYKTGDIVEERNKMLFFRGRTDSQIKKHGHRIELNEIELIGAKYQEISNCCALFNAENNQIIFVYDSKNNFETSKLKNFFSSKLPKYMIPDKFICLSKLPLNKNGKIDRNLILRNINK